MAGIEDRSSARSLGDPSLRFRRDLFAGIVFTFRSGISRVTLSADTGTLRLAYLYDTVSSLMHASS